MEICKTQKELNYEIKSLHNSDAKLLNEKHSCIKKNKMEIKKMPLYYRCELCNFSSKRHSNYDKHLQTKKHINKVEKKR